MVNFDPKYTEMLFFDLESYVPQNDRQSRASMVYNAAKPSHFILGGVFRRMFPLRKHLEPPWQVWNWEIEREKDTLLQVYEYFKQSWKMIDGKLPSHPDLILVGIGISRFDIPALYVRSMLHQIAPAVELYETYIKTKIVDLSDVGITLFKQNEVLYPKSANDLTSRLRIKSNKTSGKSVWDMFESQQFDAIKSRTASEVEDSIAIASKIMSGQF